MAITRSFRSAQDGWMAMEGERGFFVGGKAYSDDMASQVAYSWEKGKGKNIKVNNGDRKASEHIGDIPLVAILPDDTQLITGSGADRRKFLDVLLCQYSKPYLFHLTQYDKVLKQRNALLKSFHEMRYFDEEQLGLWDMQLIPHGIEIATYRKQFIQDFQPIFSKYFHYIVAQGEVPEIVYQSHLTENTEEEWKALLLEKREKDRVYQYSTAGVQRDNLQFRLNGQMIKNFGSQGQQKTFAISLRLAQYFLLKEQKQVSPILLLDDIFDKLDQYRLKQIAALVAGVLEGQVFITDTSLERLRKAFSEKTSDREVFFFQVEKGKIEPISNEEEQ